jgi:predicted aldo/keto reductase-like oxidoreductase
MGDSGIDRREFLRRGALAGASVGLLPLTGGSALAAVEPQVRRKGRLGRTGLRVSDIGFGSSSLEGDVELVQHAFDRGINYFDTAESYQGGRSEQTIGRALAGKRDKVLIASKVGTKPDSKRGSLMKSLDMSLKRLQTDHIDVYFNHAVNDVAVLTNPEWYEFTTRAKAAGKIRFTGMSGHGGRLVECLDHALDHSLVDVILVGFNFGQDPAFYQRFTKKFDFVAVQPDLPRVLRKAREKGVGIVAMKTLRGAKLNDMRPYEAGGASFAQAAFRWVFSTGLVDSLVVTMGGNHVVDEYLGASGWQAPTRADEQLLERYHALQGATQCRYGCGDCASACPLGVPISDVLRTRMYAEDYGDLSLARSEYAQLAGGAAACLTCAHQACAQACPHGLAIPELTRRAHSAISG